MYRDYVGCYIILKIIWACREKGEEIEAKI